MGLNNLLKNIQGDDDLVMAVNYYYNNVFEQHRDDRGEFHPSSSGSCPRAVGYAFAGIEPMEKINGENLRKMHNGTWMHLRYNSIFEHMSKTLTNFELLEVDIPVKGHPTLPLVGHADAIILLNGNKLLIELKSIRSFMFDRLTEPSHEYLVQWNIYSDLLGIPEGRMLYENKDTQELKQFKMHWDKDVVKAAYKEMEGIYKYLKKDTMPPLPPGIGTLCTRYSGCQFFTNCWGKIK